MKNINQLKDEIKRDSFNDEHSANIELYRRLYGEVKERINMICFAPMSNDLTDREIAFEVFHIIDALSQSFDRKGIRPQRFRRRFEGAYLHDVLHAQQNLQRMAENDLRRERGFDMRSEANAALREALNEIAGKSKDLLAHIEEIKNQSDITIEHLESIQNQEKEIASLIVLATEEHKQNEH